MNLNVLDAFFEGQCMDAYTLFGVQKAFEQKEGYRFTLWAPNARSIQVKCMEITIPMKKIDDRGIWSVFTSDIKENDVYHYLVEQVDGSIIEKMDPFSFYCEKRPATGSIVIDRKFDWEDEIWLLQRDKNMNKPVNIYEVYLGAWKKKENVNYKELCYELISYLKENHYTHIELMPLHEHPYDGSWGYQISGLYAPTSRYGTLEELKYFINECHKEKIGVLIDFVPIHFCSDAFSLNKFDGTALYEYENEEDAYSEWGTANFDLCKEEVRSFLMSAAAYWICELHIDGLRMDAISHAIYWQGKVHRGENLGALTFLKRMNYKLSTCFKGIMLIAEDSTAYPNVTKSTLEGGLGFDYKWDMGWMNDTLRYMAKDPIYRKWHHNDITFSMAYFYNEKYLLPFSHDEVVHEKKTIVNKMWGSLEDKIKQAKVLYTYMYTHPGKKLNFMGNEIASLSEFNERKEVEWFLLENEVHKKFKDYINALASVYCSYPCLYKNEYDYHYFEWIDPDNSEHNLFSYMRKDEETTLITILNMAPVERLKYRFGVSEYGFYKEILNSDHEKFGGNNVLNIKMICAKKGECNYKDYYIEVDIPAFGAIILEHKNRKKGK